MYTKYLLSLSIALSVMGVVAPADAPKRKSLLEMVAAVPDRQDAQVLALVKREALALLHDTGMGSFIWWRPEELCLKIGGEREQLRKKLTYLFAAIFVLGEVVVYAVSPADDNTFWRGVNMLGFGLCFGMGVMRARHYTERLFTSVFAGRFSSLLKGWLTVDTSVRDAASQWIISMLESLSSDDRNWAPLEDKAGGPSRLRSMKGIPKALYRLIQALGADPLMVSPIVTSVSRPGTDARAIRDAIRGLGQAAPGDRHAALVACRAALAGSPLMSGQILRGLLDAVIDDELRGTVVTAG